MAQPRDRRDFETAIVCALPLEADAVIALFDHIWDNEGEGISKAAGDPNAYTTGLIGRHNVVVAHMPGMGKVSAAGVAVGLRTSFPNVKLALVVGICGGVPRDPRHGNEIYLGDVIISQSLIEYDFGRLYPGGFRPKDITEGGLGQPPIEVRSLLSQLETSHYRQRLQHTTEESFRKVQGRLGETAYPSEKDWLFPAAYMHRHRDNRACNECSEENSSTCVAAVGASCHELGCGDHTPVQRDRSIQLPQASSNSNLPYVHVGRMGSGDTVMKSGEHRDQIASRDGVIAFEMEGAGIWKYFPSLVIKGVCDYADSHKSKGWQKYAAAAAAACANAFLQSWSETQHPPRPLKRSQTFKPTFMVGIRRDDKFIGQSQAMRTLEEKLSDHCTHNRVALVALGGMGKTRTTFEYALRLKGSSVSVFWIHASNKARILEAYTRIAKAANIVGYREDDSDGPRLVKQWFESESSGRWLIILDNADDHELLYGRDRLADIFPRFESGSIILTTRDKRVGFDFTGAASKLIFLQQLGLDHATELLLSRLDEEAAVEQQTARELCEELERIPLAIVQAAAYMQRNSTDLEEYLELYRQSPSSQIELLSEDFEDDLRDKETKNPVAATWFISFDHIERKSPLAAGLLKKMSLLDPHSIPVSLLHSHERRTELVKALGVLQGFCLITPHVSRDASRKKIDKCYDLHRLVRLAMRNWLQQRNQLRQWTAVTLKTVAKNYPDFDEEGWECLARSRTYFPHATTLLSSGEFKATETIIPDIFRDQRSSGEHVENTVPCALCSADLMINISHLLGYGEAGDRGVAYSMQATAIRTFVLGENHPLTILAMIRTATAYYDSGQIAEARDLAEIAIKRMDAGDPPPLLTAWKHQIIAFVHLEDGRLTLADTFLQKAIDIRTAELGPDNHVVLHTKFNLARFYVGSGRYSESEALLNDLLMRYTTSVGPSSVATLRAKEQLSHVYNLTGRADQAAALDAEISNVRSNSFGLSHSEGIRDLEKSAEVRYSLGSYTEASELAQQALELRIEVNGPEDLTTLSTTRLLSHCYIMQGRLDLAEELQTKLVEFQRRLSNDHRPTLVAMMDLASLYEKRYKFEMAQALREEIVQAEVRKLGANNPISVLSMCELGLNYHSQGLEEQASNYRYTTLDFPLQAPEAYLPANIDRMAHISMELTRHNNLVDGERMAQDAVNLARRHGSPVPFLTAFSLVALAFVDGQLNKLKEAEALYREALSVIKSREEGGKHIPSIMTDLARVLVHQGRYREAQMVALEAKAKLSTLPSPDQVSWFQNTVTLVITYTHLGRCSEAELLSAKILDHQIGKFSTVTAVTTSSFFSDNLDVLENLARTYNFLQRHELAKTICESSLLQIKKSAGPTSMRLLEFLLLYADTLSSLGEYLKALDTALHCKKIYLDIGERGTFSEEAVEAHLHNQIARSFMELGKLKDAELSAHEALEKTVTHFGVDHPYSVECMATRAQISRKKDMPDTLTTARLLDEFINTFGEKHPKTVAAMEELAMTYEQNGESAESEELKTRARSIKDTLDTGLTGKDASRLNDLVSQLFQKWDEAGLMATDLEKIKIVG